ncbi:2-acylglycerophosphoethanolamine acyltransferase [Legionella beliardensis]|uniref:2-acylglycerophosphoethanolamine acyltransferase n=1 Tax=Legionella beliardensis TaxID=91822 RepID=A0A378HYF7_9GAMM|nr:MFS transporter [Legionella beliardensis]STX27929.1 2-acylglycerophosphoethanolamine acyltransferase [Legionella beliardensis]
MKISRVKGFWPYLMLVFFNTFVDISHKILIQDTLYQSAKGSVYTLLSSIINAFILLPYILLFTPSGFIADKFPKVTVLRVTAALAIPLTIVITWCYFQGYFFGAFFMTLLLAVQSALNSPAKYGYIKELFGKEQLSRVNAIVQTLTIIAILSATALFTALFTYLIKAANLQQSLDKVLLLKAFAPLGFLLILFSVIETCMTFCLIQKEAVDSESTYEIVNYFKGTYLKSYLNNTRQPRIIFISIIGLSIFWAINQVLLASYGAFLKEHIGQVSVLFAQGSLAIAGIGILLGALYSGRRSNVLLELGMIPMSTIGIALSLYLLPHLTSHWAILSLFLIYGFFGGMLIVPLNALIQYYSPKHAAGKIQSANNFLQNCFMLGFLGLGILSYFYQLDSLILLHALFIIASLGALYTLIAWPQLFMRYVFSMALSFMYRFRIHQVQELPIQGGILLLGNHVSFIDWALLQAACPRPIRFVIDKSFYNKWYAKWLFKLFKTIPIAPGDSRLALIKINQALNAGEVVALFPEGQLTRDGQLGVFRTGFERAAKDAKALIIPFYLHGMWGSRTSRAPEKIKGVRRAVSITFGSAVNVNSNAEQVKQHVQALSLNYNAVNR